MRDALDPRLSRSLALRPWPQPVLLVDRLGLEVQTANGWYPIVRDLSLRGGGRRNAGLVGESGCGKSLTALAIMRLLPRGARIDGGRIRFGGVDLAALDERELRDMRGNAPRNDLPGADDLAESGLTIG